jgi:hypothetical protein
MLKDDEQWLAIADEFYNAAVDPDRWYDALAKLADATGSSSGELITIGHDAALPVHIMTNVDPGILAASDEHRIGDPETNPRVKAGMNAPLLKVIAECDFITPAEHAIHPHYNEFARPWDIPYICLTTLERQDNLLIGLAVVRSERDGHIDSTQRGVFASLAPHVRAAVKMQIALEGGHLRVKAVGRSLLDRVDEADPVGGTSPLEECRCERPVGVHAIEAVVRGRHGRGQHLPFRPDEARAGEVVDEQLVGEAPEVDAETGCQPDRRQDPGSVGQPADEGRLLRTGEALVIAGHRWHLLRASWTAEVSGTPRYRAAVHRAGARARLRATPCVPRGRSPPRLRDLEQVVP